MTDFSKPNNLENVVSPRSILTFMRKGLQTDYKDSGVKIKSAPSNDVPRKAAVKMKMINNVLPESKEEVIKPEARRAHRVSGFNPDENNGLAKIFTEKLEKPSMKAGENYKAKITVEMSRFRDRLRHKLLRHNRLRTNTQDWDAEADFDCIDFFENDCQVYSVRRGTSKSTEPGKVRFFIKDVVMLQNLQAVPSWLEDEYDDDDEDEEYDDDEDHHIEEKEVDEGKGTSDNRRLYSEKQTQKSEETKDEYVYEEEANSTAEDSDEIFAYHQSWYRDLRCPRLPRRSAIAFTSTAVGSEAFAIEPPRRAKGRSARRRRALLFV